MSSSPRLTRTMPPLSARAVGAQSSAIRDLLDQAKRPGMISLAGGLPDARLFPLPELGHIAAHVIATNGQQVLQYGATRGNEAARASLASLYSPSQDPDELVITTGSQQGLDLLSRVLLDPGDAVVVSDPDYLGALQVFRSYGADLCPIAIDADGMDTDLLEEKLRWGLRPKFCYLVPHFHNPTGASMSAARRCHLDALSQKYGFVVVEDDPYAALRYEGTEPHAPALAGDPELTVRLRSVSKTLTPGLRVGAMAGPSWLLEPVVTAKQSCDLHTSTLSQAVAAAALQSDWFPSHLQLLRSTYKAKRDTMMVALTDSFGDRVSFAAPAGGMFLWARFDGCANTADWLHRCLDQGVCFVPGAAFGITRDLTSHARLSFATGSQADLVEGVARMRSAQPG